MGGKGKYSIGMLLGSILAGLVYGVFGEVFYRIGERFLPSILLTAFYFTGLFLFLGLAVYLIGKLIYSQSRGNVNITQWVITFILIIALSCLFEFIYDVIQPGNKRKGYDSYLFVIDESGSMETNDPERKRWDAFNSLMETKPDDFQYGIYIFNDEPQQVRGMSPNSVPLDLSGEYWIGGGTAIKSTLSRILSDIENGQLGDVKNCRIVLLSDGYATDVDTFNKYLITSDLDEFSKLGYSISTIGLGEPDDELMSLIASKTGGVYVKIDDASQLEQSMVEATALNKISRNLLGYRDNTFMNWLLGILRILFVIGLGVIIALEKTILCERFINTTSVLISSVIGSALAGFCLEIGMNGIGIPPQLMRIITCILIAFVFLRHDLLLKGNRGANAKGMDGYDNYDSYDSYDNYSGGSYY